MKGSTFRNTEVHKAAREVSLRYTLDDQPGIRRIRAGKVFQYLLSSGKHVRDDRVLRRIRSLAVPPAWTEVWICRDPAGHLQATGRDSRGRKQYRYHPRWREARDENKFERMLAFGKALPRIRRRVGRDIRRQGLGREKVVASVVRLLELTAARIGNEEYASSNHSYGLTTLRDHHVQVDKTTLRLRYRGKSGKLHSLDFDHPRLARIVQRCRDLPGMRLFQYVDEDGAIQTVTSSDVNSYLAEVSGGDFSAKDFRTWTGTVVAALALQELGSAASLSNAQENIRHAIERVAEHLNNTPAICKKCYVHPAILEAYTDGVLTAPGRHRRGAPGRRGILAQKNVAPPRVRWQEARHGLRPEERAILAVLQARKGESDADRLVRKLQASLIAVSAGRKRG